MSQNKMKDFIVKLSTFASLEHRRWDIDGNQVKVWTSLLLVVSISFPGQRFPTLLFDQYIFEPI